jgi:hypothetical protein
MSQRSLLDRSNTMYTYRSVDHSVRAMSFLASFFQEQTKKSTIGMHSACVYTQQSHLLQTTEQTTERGNEHTHERRRGGGVVNCVNGTVENCAAVPRGVKTNTNALFRVHDHEGGN